MYLILTKIFIYIFIFFSFFSNYNSYSLNKNILYSKKSISNYFSGVISSSKNNDELAVKYFNNLSHLRNNHDKFNSEFVFSLVQTGQIPEVFDYLKKLKEENLNFFDANLLLATDYFYRNNYRKSAKYINSIIKTEKFSDFEKLIAQLFLGYIKLFEDQTYEYKKVLNYIPENYVNFVLINDAFANCYLDNKKIDSSFLGLINPNGLNFTRYKFFYVNFLLSKKRKFEALEILNDEIDILDPNLLLHQTRLWLEKGRSNNVNKIFDCQRPTDLIAEFFYLIANLYSGQQNYKLSNFYLNLSIYLNPSFSFNKALLAENYFYLKKYENSKKIYLEFNFENGVFGWHATKRLAWIKSKTKNVESAINLLDKSFKKLKNPNVKHYYDLANFYKDFAKYQKSIKYYTKVLKNISKNNKSYSKILYRRGMSYERLKMWKKSEQDLIQSLVLEPEEPYVLNYLAYSWLERNINLNKSIEMLKLANKKKINDPYIMDSLGWGMYLTKRYKEAEEHLQKAIQLMPLDPIVNDHYADILWQLNKKLQAEYFWNYVLNLENTEDEMKEKIRKKLIFGVQDQS